MEKAQERLVPQPWGIPTGEEKTAQLRAVITSSLFRVHLEFFPERQLYPFFDHWVIIVIKQSCTGWCLTHVPPVFSLCSILQALHRPYKDRSSSLYLEAFGLRNFSFLLCFITDPNILDLE